MSNPTYFELLSRWVIAMQLLEYSLANNERAVAQNAALLKFDEVTQKQNDKMIALLERQADEIDRLRNELNQQRWITGDTWESTLVQ